jgi:hypothetical protein
LKGPTGTQTPAARTIWLNKVGGNLDKIAEVRGRKRSAKS